MYTFVTSTCLSRSIGAQWKEYPNLDQMLVYLIFETFTKAYLTLTNPNIQGEVYVDMDVLRAEYSSYNNTLEQLLIDLGDTALPTVPELPSTQIKYAKYSDAIRAGYNVQLTVAGLNLPDNFPAGDKHDLVVTRPGYDTSMSLLDSHCLVSVNGYYHWTETDGEKAFVMKGADTMRKSNLNHMGLWSFMDVGELTKVKIDPDDIVPAEPNQALKDKILFTVPNDLDGKSFLLILGGYIVLPQEDVFWRNGENSFLLDINKIPYPERIFESSLYLDLSPLGLTHPVNNPENGYFINEIYSDAVIKKYMTLSQSFLVIVDIAYMTSAKIGIDHADLPGMFTAYQDPTYPLIVNYGKVAEYWKTFESGYWSVSVQDSYMRNFVISEKPITQQQEVSDNLLAGNPFYHSRGFLLQLAGYQSL